MGALRSVSAWHSCLSLLNSCCRAGSLYPLPPQYAGAYGSLGMEQLAAWHQVTLVMTWWHDDMMTWWHDEMMTWWPLSLCVPRPACTSTTERPLPTPASLHPPASPATPRGRGPASLPTIQASGSPSSPTITYLTSNMTSTGLQVSCIQMTK